MNRIISKTLLTIAALLTLGTANAEVTYYHTNLQGSPVAATDESGNVKWREQYKPFGERIENQQAAADNRQWYTGKFHDNDTGLTYMGARYYDPIVGRFMGIDPIGYAEAVPSSFNRYSYAANNPYIYNDPDGEFINFVIGGVKAAVENVVIQHIEMQLGLRDEFSFGELALDTTLGTVTSGLSSVKNAGKLAILADKANDAKKKRKRTAEDPIRREHGQRTPDPEAAGRRHSQLGTRTSSQNKVEGGAPEKYKQAVEFDEAGKPVKEIDFTDHKTPDVHTNPHQHRFDPVTGKRGGAEPLD